MNDFLDDLSDEADGTDSDEPDYEKNIKGLAPQVYEPVQVEEVWQHKPKTKLIGEIQNLATNKI